MITYCYQTLVEDGLLNRSLFIHFYEEMISWLEKFVFSDYKITSKNLRKFITIIKTKEC